jgi:hypothetical protein
MKKSKFFILAGAVTLSILSFYGRKAHTTATKIYAGSTYKTLISGGGSNSTVLTTVSPGAGTTAFFKTKSASSWITMKTSNSGTAAVLYFHS